MALTTLQTLALAKAAGELAKKADKLTVGAHPVDIELTIRVKGTMNKAADTDKAPTVSIPLKATLALALQKAGIQAANIARIMEETMTEALNMGEQGEARILAALPDVEVAMARVDTIIGKLPRTKVSGATTGKLTLEVVEPATI